VKTLVALRSQKNFFCDENGVECVYKKIEYDEIRYMLFPFNFYVLYYTIQYSDKHHHKGAPQQAHKNVSFLI